MSMNMNKKTGITLIMIGMSVIFIFFVFLDRDNLEAGFADKVIGKNVALKLGNEPCCADDRFAKIPPECGACIIFPYRYPFGIGIILVLAGIGMILIPSKATPKPSSPQSTAATDRIEKMSQELSLKGLSWNWKSFIAASVITIFLVIFVSEAFGVKHQKNMIWTVWWLYLTIESWKYWRWKALLPYPLFILAYIMTISILMGVGVEYRSLTNLIVLMSLNIMGLATFYMYFRKAQSNLEEWHISKKPIAEVLELVGFLLCNILLVVTLTGKMDNNLFRGFYDKLPRGEAPKSAPSPAMLNLKYTGYIKGKKIVEAQFNGGEWCKVGMEIDGYVLNNIKPQMVTFIHGVTGEKIVIQYYD
jgi:uncharacterized membrane protein YfcA